MSDAKLNPILKLVLDVGPLAVFFLAFRFAEDLLALPSISEPLAAVIGPDDVAGKSGPLFLATVLFMISIAATLTVSWVLTRHLPRMAIVTAVVVTVFGGLTLWLKDETFIKMKPTLVNTIFAVILGFGLLRGRSYIKDLLGDSLPVSDRGWMIFTQRWVIFFLFLAALNEFVWRTQSTDFWVTFKTFSGIPITLAFLVTQWPLLKRHMIEDPGG